MEISKFNNFAVALDDTDMDMKIMDYLKIFLPLYSVKKIIFFTLLIKGESPKHKNFATNFENFVRKHTQSFLNVDLKIKILETQNPLDTIEKIIKKDNIQSIVVGRKNLNSGTGVLSKALSLRVLCNVVTVTQRFKTPIKHILLPIDFSERSKLCLDWVIQANSYFNFDEVVCLNTHKLPSGYTSSGKSVEEFSKILQKNIKDKFEFFISPYRNSASNINFKGEFHLQTKALHEIIFDIALLREVDLIVISTQGRTPMAATILASTTERLLEENLIIPTFVLKKDKNMGLLKALRKI